ncbi:hypothetical protein [Nonomuraea endophytica]|uniref:hypothetical protein n=1 Tax=Nonomuraea endophytica TaxID=714136 RepID=UPI0037C5FC97
MSLIRHFIGYREYSPLLHRAVAGIAVSSGVVEGRGRVILNIADSSAAVADGGPDFRPVSIGAREAPGHNREHPA